MKFNRKHLQTIAILAAALAVIWWVTQNKYFLYVAGFLVAVSLLLPVVAKWVHNTWMKLAEAIGFVMNRVLLTIVFVLIVIPFGVLTRITGKSNIRLKRGGDSYFKDRNHTYTKEDLENMW